MRTVVVLAIVVLLAAAVESKKKGWWRRTSKSVGVEVSHGPKGPTVKGSLTIKWRKRRAAEEHKKYSVVLQLNPCEFESYDENRDGVIKFDEIKDIFNDTAMSGMFFDEADSNDDGSITKEEFAQFSKKISGCEN